jgi:hypothetical protein
MAAMTCALVEKLQTIADPRRQCANLKHPLVDVILLGFCGVLGGCEDFVEIAEWAQVHEAAFRSFLELPHGIPAHDTFTRVFALLKPTTLQEVLLPWLLERRGLPGEWIHLDGKTLRHTGRTTPKLKALHVVSAWAGQTGITLGQVAVDAKSNEITAMPELLELLDLHDKICDDGCDGVSEGHCADDRGRGAGTTFWQSKTINRPCTPSQSGPLPLRPRPGTVFAALHHRRPGPRARGTAYGAGAPRASPFVGSTTGAVAGGPLDRYGHARRMV